MPKSSPYQLKSDQWSSHSIIQKWLNDLNPQLKVVEVGTATGILGKLLLNEHSYKLIGIELNQHWANQAKIYYDEIIVSDINFVGAGVFKDSDCVILADILEHLINPEATLSKIVSFLPNESHILVSVPNIANICIRINLLLGNFNYSERGILDRTHVRFFTYKSFKKILNESGLSINEMSFTPIPLGLLHQFFLTNFFGRLTFKLLAFITKLLPTIFAYQFLALCEKKN